MTMNILTHQFSEAEELWLKYAAEADNFDPRLARVALYDHLPSNFDPKNIDTRFYQDHQLTIIGLRRFKPDAPILNNIERLALLIKSKLLSNPGIEKIDAQQIGDELNISWSDTNHTIKALNEFMPFFTGLTYHQDSQIIKEVCFYGTNGYDAPLRFTTLDAALENKFRLLHFSKLLEPEYPPSSKFNSSPKGKNAKEHNSAKKDVAFIIMPIDPNRPELEDVLDAIKTIASEFGITAYRADEIQHQDMITDVVLNEIRDCEYLIADLSFERPNVYYEIGYAHALNKKPILYRRHGTKLHFDLSVHNVPEYENTKELKNLLRMRFEAILGRKANSAK